MRIAASAVLVGAASASLLVPQGDRQHVLGGDEKPLDAGSALPKPFTILDAVNDINGDLIGKAIEETMRLVGPDAFEKLGGFSEPKKHTRRPDSHWDYIVKGAELPGAFSTTDGGDEAKDSLNAYNLRVKTVDPSKLGIDKVKQYSGYLDDDENDKHLFYCMAFRGPCLACASYRQSS